MSYEEVVKAIIKEQSQILGDSLAKQMALESGVVRFNSIGVDDISLSEQEPKIAITKLIDSYARLFGPASIEVCANIVKKYYGTEASSFLQSFAS